EGHRSKWSPSCRLKWSVPRDPGWTEKHSFAMTRALPANGSKGPAPSGKAEQGAANRIPDCRPFRKSANRPCSEIPRVCFSLDCFSRLDCQTRVQQVRRIALGVSDCRGVIG